MSQDKKQLAKIALEQRAVSVARDEPYQVSDETLRVLREKFGVASIDLSRVQIPLVLLELIPREIAEVHGLLPLCDTGDALHVAMADPTNQKSIDELSFVVGKDIVPFAVPAVDLEAALGAAYLAARRGERYFCGPRYEGPTPASTGTSLAEFIPVRDAARDPHPKGTTPASSEPAARERPEPARIEPDIAFVVPDLDLGGDPVGAPAVSVAAAQQPIRGGVTASGPLVLVVEDSDELLRLMAGWLESAGYRVVTALDGNQAVELLKQESPDLLVLDAVLPGLHGFDLVRRLKGSRRYATLPVVMVSGLHRGWSLHEDLRAMGVADYLEKPIRAAQLLRSVGKALGQKPKAVRSAAAECLKAGLSAFKQGDSERAMQELLRATELDPDAPELHVHLGLLQGQRGQLFEAIASLERAVELEGRDFPTVKNLAILYQQAGFQSRSREMWQRALHLAPDDVTKTSIQERLKALHQ